MVPSAGQGGPYNYDMWDVGAIGEGILHADKYKAVVLSPQVNALWDDSQAAVDVATGLADWAANYAEPGVDTFEPFSTVTFPIYDSLENVKVDTDGNAAFVGNLLISLMWRTLIENILPENSDGIILVFEDSCGPPFTYRLNGPEAIFLGGSDLHDPAYEDMRISASLPYLANSKDGSSSYTGLPLAAEYCPRMIHIYPSKDMENDHSTSDPVVVTVGAALIFLFTSIVFVMYDFWVNRRQRIVMNRALASGAIVSSLYPEQVRNQLYEEKERAAEHKRAGVSFLAQPKTSDMTDIKKSRPNANEFTVSSIVVFQVSGDAYMALLNSLATCAFNLELHDLVCGPRWVYCVVGKKDTSGSV